MARWYEAANEASFKTVAEGYVFQSPNPWIFALPRYYLVNETQKADILAHMGRWRLFQMISVLSIFVFMGSFMAFVTLSPATFVGLAKPVIELGVGVSTTLIAVLLTLLVAPLVAAPLIYLNRGLRPSLEHATRTEERIAMAEQLPKIAGAVSGKLLVVGLAGAICLMGAAVLSLIDGYSEGHLSRSLLVPFLPLFASSGVATFYFVYLLRLRAKSKRAAV